MQVLTALLLLTAAAAPAQLEIFCGTRPVVLQLFADHYGPWQISSRHRQQNTTVEVLHAADTRTWAVMGENYRGQHCIGVRQTDHEPRALPIT